MHEKSSGFYPIARYTNPGVIERGSAISKQRSLVKYSPFTGMCDEAKPASM
jgi:hypothetical protein